MKMQEIMHENCSYPHLQGVCQCIVCTFQGFVNASERGVILRQLIDVGGCWHEAPSACRDWNARGTNTFSRTYQFFIVTQNTARLALLTSSSLALAPIYHHYIYFACKNARLSIERHAFSAVFACLSIERLALSAVFACLSIERHAFSAVFACLSMEIHAFSAVFACLSIERHAFAGDFLPELGPQSIINGFIS